MYPQLLTMHNCENNEHNTIQFTYILIQTVLHSATQEYPKIQPPDTQHARDNGVKV